MSSLDLSTKIYAPIDFENGDRYLMSPRSGKLMVIPGNDWGLLDTRAILLSNGIEDIEQTSLILDERTLQEQVYIDWYGNKPVIPKLEKYRFRVTSVFLRLLLALAPIDYCVKYRHILQIGFSYSPLSLNLCLYFLNEFSPQNDGKCLLRSFERAFFLSRHGYSCEVFIGTWMPTTYLHAWATLFDPHNNKTILVSDNVDKISHYQPLIRFSFNE